MKLRIRKYEEMSPIGALLMREKAGLRRYRKQRKRDPEEKEILMDLAMKKIEEEERNDFIVIGPRRRRLRME